MASFFVVSAYRFKCRAVSAALDDAGLGQWFLIYKEINLILPRQVSEYVLHGSLLKRGRDAFFELSFRLLIVVVRRKVGSLALHLGRSSLFGFGRGC